MWRDTGNIYCLKASANENENEIFKTCTPTVLSSNFQPERNKSFLSSPPHYIILYPNGCVKVKECVTLPLCHYFHVSHKISLCSVTAVAMVRSDPRMSQHTYHQISIHECLHRFHGLGTCRGGRMSLSYSYSRLWLLFSVRFFNWPTINWKPGIAYTAPGTVSCASGGGKHTRDSVYWLQFNCESASAHKLTHITLIFIYA